MAKKKGYTPSNQTYTKKKLKVTPDGFTGAGSHMVGTANRYPNRTEVRAATANNGQGKVFQDYVAADMKRKGMSKKQVDIYNSVANFERKRAATSRKKGK